MLLSGVRQIAERYDYFLFDVWGTLHDGVSPYPGTRDCLARLARAGKKIALLSNVPARTQTVVDRIAAIGIAPESYHLIRSSGEQVREALASGELADRLGGRYYYLGAGDERDLVPDEHAPDGGAPSVSLRKAMRPEEADFVLCVGPAPGRHTVADHHDILRTAARRGLPMVCANPDRTVMRGNEILLCAGGLAAAYRDEFGGTVRWFGKPYRAAFDGCLAALGATDRGRAVMIGDTLQTDIAGGHGAGLATVLIGGGIHARALGLSRPGDAIAAADLAALLAGAPTTPTAVLPYLAW